jgi:hypothetical protein
VKVIPDDLSEGMESDGYRSGLINANYIRKGRSGSTESAFVGTEINVGEAVSVFPETV